MVFGPAFLNAFDGSSLLFCGNCYWLEAAQVQSIPSSVIVKHAGGGKDITNDLQIPEEWTVTFPFMKRKQKLLLTNIQ